MKREFPLTDRPSRARLAKLITAIANASGGTGYFIVGVVEKDRKGNSLDEVICGVNDNLDNYQRLIQQSLHEFTNPVPKVGYQEIDVPETRKRIGVMLIDVPLINLTKSLRNAKILDLVFT
jgi:predicted HTH transcriptional regulator